jgi:hypothetical protein
MEGLPDRVIPIFPSEIKFNIPHQGQTIRITRCLPAIMASYAFTDYKSQGQTIECVIVNLGKPPWGALTAFNAYVALSQNCSHGTIRLLWDFEDILFTTHPSEELRDKDDQLEELTEGTRIKFERGSMSEVA